jgi:guanylate kinase
MINHPLVIISAPSGSGKGTVLRHLLQRDPRLALAISATTRAPREDEVHGIHYYFLTLEEFQDHIDSGNFVEWEEVYPGVMYGTLRSELTRLWEEEKIIIFELDVNGALALKQEFGSQVLSIFLLPPSLEELKQRLIHRGAETAEEIEIRIERATYEMSQQVHFDARVLNQDLERAVMEVAEIIDMFVYQDIFAAE